jgi:DNA polymerase-3 subunit gamma/tau
MVEHLEYVAAQEGVPAEPEALNIIAQKADGGMRDALSIFDQLVSFTNGNITYRAVIDNLNVLDYEYYFRLTDHMLAGNVREALLTLNDILAKGFDGQNIISGLASHFRDLLVCRDPATLILFEVGASIRERYKETAQRCPDPLLYKAIELSAGCDLNYRLSRNKRLLLELTLIQLCQLTQSPPDDSKKKTLTQPVDSPVVTTQLPSGAGQPPPAAPPRKTAPPILSTSIKKMGKPNDKDDSAPAASAATEQLAPFTTEELAQYWNEYAQAIEGNEYLKNTMINCRPALQEDFHFEVSVHNPGQQDELLGDSIKLLPFLRRQLKNTRIQMRILISETNEKKTPYTTAEKYEHLLRVNPMFGKLIEELNLTPA